MKFALVLLSLVVVGFQALAVEISCTLHPSQTVERKHTAKITGDENKITFQRYYENSPTIYKTELPRTGSVANQPEFGAWSDQDEYIKMSILASVLRPGSKISSIPFPIRATYQKIGHYKIDVVYYKCIKK